MFLGIREAEKAEGNTASVGMKGGFSFYSCTTQKPSGLSGSTSNDTSLDTRAAAASLLPSETVMCKEQAAWSCQPSGPMPALWQWDMGPHVPSSHPTDSPVHDVGGQGS